MTQGESGGMPTQAVNTSDWGQMFRDIVSYGATRYFDSQAINNLYQGGNGGYAISPDGVTYQIGQPATEPVIAQTSTGGLVISPALLLIGGLLLFVALKD